VPSGTVGPIGKEAFAFVDHPRLVRWVIQEETAIAEVEGKQAVACAAVRARAGREASV
jgi:hypothetical protein